MSIENARNSIKEIIFDKNLIDEFLNLRNDKLFEFCKKNSDLKFTQEEFESAVKEILATAFPEEFGLNILNENLEKIAGGKNNLVTKITASTLALMSLGGGLFTKNETPFSAPSAKAGLFSSKYVVPNPWEVDEVIGAVFNNDFCKNGYESLLNSTRIKLTTIDEKIKNNNAKITALANLLSEHSDYSNGDNDDVYSGLNAIRNKEDKAKLADFCKDSSKGANVYVDPTGVLNVKNVAKNIKNLQGKIFHWNSWSTMWDFRYYCRDEKLKLESENQILKSSKEATNTKLESLNRLVEKGSKGLKDSGFDVVDINKFKQEWSKNNFEKGKEWWQKFIAQNHFMAPDWEEPNWAKQLGLAMMNIDPSKNPVPADEDLLAVESLLGVYHTALFQKNGYFNDVSLSSISGLTNSKEYLETINSSFGTFSVWNSGKGRPYRYDQPASQYSHRIVKMLCSASGDRNKDYTLSKMAKAAPWVAIGAVAYFGSSTFRSLFSMAGPTVDKIKSASRKAWRRFIYNRLSLEKDPVKLKELMSEYLKSSVMCQDKAINKMVEIMSGMADLWNESDRTGKDCTSACTMTFMGDSGIGKTYAARCLSKALFYKDMQPWQFITSTSVTASSNGSSSSDSKKDTKNKENNVSHEKLSPADQLFNENSELVRQLRLNNRVIIVLDEIDKMHKADPDDTILERLRDARDTGKLLVRKGVNYEYIDVSRTIFICITNERRECWGLPEANLTEDQAASRTYVKRDRSLTNRFDVVEFDYFTSNGYQIVLKPQLEELADEYYNNYKINLKITDELVKNIGDAAERKNKGVRGVNDYLVALRGKLVDYRSKNKIFRTNKDVVDLSVIYDSYTNSFEILDGSEY